MSRDNDQPMNQGGGSQEGVNRPVVLIPVSGSIPSAASSPLLFKPVITYTVYVTEQQAAMLAFSGTLLQASEDRVLRAIHALPNLIVRRIRVTLLRIARRFVCAVLPDRRPLSLAAVAVRMHLRVSRVRELIRTHRLKAIKRGKRLLVRSRSIDEYYDEEERLLARQRFSRTADAPRPKAALDPEVRMIMDE